MNLQKLSAQKKYSETMEESLAKPFQGLGTSEANAKVMQQSSAMEMGNKIRNQNKRKKKLSGSYLDVRMMELKFFAKFM